MVLACNLVPTFTKFRFQISMVSLVTDLAPMGCNHNASQFRDIGLGTDLPVIASAVSRGMRGERTKGSPEAVSEKRSDSEFACA